MTPRFILITTAAILLSACDRRSAEADAAKAAQIAVQQQAEQAANEKITQLEARLNVADQQKAADREAELTRVKEELAQIKQEKEQAAERIRDLQNEVNKPAPIAEAPARDADEPRAKVIRADLERSVAEEEDREPVYTGRVVPETQRVTNVESFYEPLDRYGDWIQTDDYGYVFRPEVAARPGWRPYTDGHWVHSGYGWTWQSNEQFGWATYHYGRWTRIDGEGWAWVPGREWGPGWVSWRRGKEHCGWAPLPPESQGRHSFTASVDRDYDIGPAAYTFIALSSFGAHSYAQVVEPPQENVNIINQTVNVTNIAYNNTTNNNTIVYNGGPNYDLMRARSRQPVENVNVNFAAQNPAGNPAKIANVRQGDNFHIAAPPIAVAANAAPPRVKAQIGTPKHDHGWEGVDPAQMQKVKQNIAATSTERPKGPRPAFGGSLPATPKPAAIPGAVAPVLPARPEHPLVAAPTPAPVELPVVPTKVLPIAPKLETPAHPPVAVTPAADPVKPPVEPAKILPITPKPEAPAHPPVVVTPTTEPAKLPIEPAKTPQVAPKPLAPAHPPVVEKTHPLDPVPVKPKSSVDLPNPVKPDATEPHKMREVEPPATPNPIHELPKKPAAPSAPIIHELPHPPVSKPAPPQPKVEAPAKPKAPVEEPVRIRPTPEPAAPRPPQVEHRPAPLIEKPVAPKPQPPVERIAPPRPPQEVRAPEPRVERPPVQAEQKPQRPPAPAAPVAQHPPQPQAQPAPAPHPKPGADSDKNKKKKDGEQ